MHTHSCFWLYTTVFSTMNSCAIPLYLAQETSPLYTLPSHLFTWELPLSCGLVTMPTSFTCSCYLPHHIRIASYHIIISKGEWQFYRNSILDRNYSYITLLECMYSVLLLGIAIHLLLYLIYKFYHRCVDKKDTIYVGIWISYIFRHIKISTILSSLQIRFFSRTSEPKVWLVTRH